MKQKVQRILGEIHKSINSEKDDYIKRKQCAMCVCGDKHENQELQNVMEASESRTRNEKREKKNS